MSRLKQHKYCDYQNVSSVGFLVGNIGAQIDWSCKTLCILIESVLCNENKLYELVSGIRHKLPCVFNQGSNQSRIHTI